MTQTEIIKKWEYPQWHPDFGDAEIELLLLKAFCLEVFRLYPNLRFKLNDIEEGYLSVSVLNNQETLVEIMVVETQPTRFGLFFENDDEVYVSQIKAIESVLKNRW